MKVLQLTIAFVFILLVSSAQNLVLNPSFEGGNGSLCDPMVWASDYQFYVSPWECPTNGTSDIFNKDIPNQYCWAAMPGRQGGVIPRVGSQMPRTGSRFAGIYVYGTANYREYLHTELITPLVPGKTYCAEMYVSLADRVHKASNNLGMHFGTKRIRIYITPPTYDLFTGFLHVSPQILETNVIQDSISWVKINGNLLADSAYTHLTIGNFFSREDTQVIEQPGRGASYIDRSYYFIEDVSVYELPLKPFSFEGITTICEGNTAAVKVLGGLEEIKWTTLDDTLTVISTGPVLTINPQITTSYRMSGKTCKKLFQDTVKIMVVPFAIPYLGKDTTICKGTSITFNAGNGYHEYKWQDQSTESEITAVSAGVYSVTVKNEFGCTAYDEVSLSLKEAPQAKLGEDAVVCNDYPQLITGSNTEEYLWSTGATEPSISIGEAGMYWVRVENRCGVDYDTVNIYSYDSLRIPNVITLNNDDTNEQFVIKGLPPQTNSALTIFNRWGRKVFSQVNYLNDWPNQNEQEDLPSGVYYYTIEIPGCKSYKGWLHILR